MERVNFKPVFCGTTVAMAIVVLLTFCHEGVCAGQLSSSPDAGSRAFFAEQSAGNKTKAADNSTGIAASRKDNREKEKIADSAQDDTDNRPVAWEELPDWQLLHSEILPYGDYFIDTRIVGAVRYHADFSLETEYEILRELANIQKDLVQYLAIPPPRETIEVFFFDTKKSYQRFLSKEMTEAPFDRDALYVKKSGPGMVLIYRHANMKEDLRHEMTHAFLHAAMPYVPIWLDEGLAEYFEKPRETRGRDNPYFTSISRKIIFGSVPPMGRLERLKYFDQMGNNEYCEAWSWVHFMIHYSRDTHQMLAGYIQLLSEHGDQTPPLEPYLTKTVPETKKAYLEHFRNWKSQRTAQNAEHKTQR